MDTLIKKAFVKKILQEEAKRLDKTQTAAIRKLLNFHSGRLDRDREQSVSSGSELDGMLTLSIPGYGRMLDIKPKNRKFASNISKNRLKLHDRRSKRKAYPIYNKITFGHYNAIAYKLMYGLTNEVADNIKKELSQIN